MGHCRRATPPPSIARLIEFASAPDRPTLVGSLFPVRFLNYHRNPALAPAAFARCTATAAVALLVVLGGCVQSKPFSGTPVRVNATAQGPVEKGTPYHIVAAQGPAAESTLLYAEAARVVNAALGARGLYAAPNLERAKIIVEIDYGMAPPRAGERAAIDPASTSPRRDLPGDDEIAKLRSAARGPLVKHLVLTAREAKPAEDALPRVLWRVELTVTDLSNDLRKYLPLLAAVGIDQIGIDSGGAVTVYVKETDKTVLLLKQQAQ